jgi:hypothetical protein
MGKAAGTPTKLVVVAAALRPLHLQQALLEPSPYRRSHTRGEVHRSTWPAFHCGTGCRIGHALVLCRLSGAAALATVHVATVRTSRWGYGAAGGPPTHDAVADCGAWRKSKEPAALVMMKGWRGYHCSFYWWLMTGVAMAFCREVKVSRASWAELGHVACIQ